jgi:tRNA (Thr-GGU) A37 N-methylase
VPIGWVESPLTDRAQAPRQGDEGAPPAWIAFEPEVSAGIHDLRVGAVVMVLTWLDRADRHILFTRLGDDPQGHAPIPSGRHRVQVVAVDGLRVLVHGLEAIDGIPVADVKPVLDKAAER